LRVRIRVRAERKNGAECYIIFGGAPFQMNS